MKRRIEDWTIEKLLKARARMTFPEYQRQPNLWSTEKKSLLIDSILRDFDIPKLYFNETADRGIEVVDGQQRLWAIWEFVDGEYAYATDAGTHTFTELTAAQREAFGRYKLQATIFDDAPDDYLRTLFLRLQLGLLLVTGEKLHATGGAMKELVFETLPKHRFVRHLKIPKRRYAIETLCAQLVINSFGQAKMQTFVRTRYEDLLFFFREYEKPEGRDRDFFEKQAKKINALLDELWRCFGDRTEELSNRSYVLSIYLLLEALQDAITTDKERTRFADFVLTLWKRLRQEISSGIDRGNRELYAFESMLSSAPGERYRIEQRHQRLIDYYEHFKKTGKIKGD